MRLKSIHLLVTLFLCASMVFVTNIQAAGIGAYVSYAGSHKVDENNESKQYFNSDNVAIDTCGYGIVMDTNLSGPEVFNYRLSLGFDRLKLPSDDDAWRISMDHTFGFRIIQNDNFRLWVGPQFHLSGGQWNLPGARQRDNQLYYSDDVEEYLDVYGIGGGVVIGTNSNFFEFGSICAELGARFQGNFTENFHIRDYDSGTGTYDNIDKANFSYGEELVFFRVSMMFGK